MLIEACVGDVAGAVAAAGCGADRLELCADLASGGTTPAADVLASALGAVPAVPIQVMIRPRGGGFSYSRAEQAAMLGDAKAVLALARSAGRAVGLVTGALTGSGEVDAGFVAEFLAVAQGSDVTFHKAIDASRDLVASLEVLASLGVTRILTSGGQTEAADGAGVIADLVRRAGPGLTVMAGGGVRPGNVASLVDRTGVTEVHLRAEPARLVAGVRSALRAGGRGG